MTQKYYGLNGLDAEVEKYLPNEGGYFIELGANDGLTQSNTAFLEFERGWRGVLIEPVVHNYLKCIVNRSSENKFFCNACVPFDYDKPYVELMYSNLMTASTGMESDIKDYRKHAENGQKHLRNDDILVEFMSPAKTLNQVLVEADAPANIDFLSLDVEGAEISVLKGLNFEQYNIQNMLIENRNIEKLSDFLESHNYELIERFGNKDFLFARN